MAEVLSSGSVSTKKMASAPAEVGAQGYEPDFTGPPGDRRPKRMTRSTVPKQKSTSPTGEGLHDGGRVRVRRNLNDPNCYTGKYSCQKWYEGTIEATDPGGYTIKYADGNSVPMQRTEAKLMQLNGTRKAIDKAGTTSRI